MKKTPFFTQTGFTLVELIFVISLLAVVVGMLFIGFRNYLSYQQHTQTMQEVVSILQTAQTNARLSVGGSTHGVKVESNRITRFAGPVYSSSDPENVIFSFPTFTFTPTLDSGSDEIIFTILSGIPMATGTITVSDTNYTDDVEVSRSGIVQ